MSEQENDDQPFAISEDLVQSPQHKEAGTTSIDLNGHLNPALKLHEDLSNGCGGQLWPAGMILANYLLRESILEFCTNKQIVELGAGGGLVGLALALALQQSKPKSQHHIVLTDQAAMMPLLKHNLALNTLGLPYASAELLDWAQPTTLEPPDILLAADCVYYEPAFPLLLKTLENLIAEQTVCFFSFKKRRRADMQFVKSARKAFHIMEIEDDPARETWSRQGLFMYRLTKRKQSE